MNFANSHSAQFLCAFHGHVHCFKAAKLMLRGLPSLSRSDWEHLIDEWILSERYRGILKRKILDDWSHERIAEREGLSVNGVKKIIARCVNVLREHATEPPG